MDLTTTLSGSFVGTGSAVYIPLRCGVDWMKVYNYTQSNFASGAGTGGNGLQYYWQYGMAAGDGFAWVNNAGATAIYQTTEVALGTGGFTYIDSSLNFPGPLSAYTAGTNAAPPVITVVSTAGLSDGNIVRITSSATAANAAGIDYSIHVINGTTFSLRNMIAPGSVFGAGTYRVIAFNPIFYPQDRIITDIYSSGTLTDIATSVDVNYQVGDLVRLSFPGGTNATTLWGSYGVLDQMIATVVAVTPASGASAGYFTINVNTTGFGTFTWPVVANVPFTYPQVFAFGGYTDATTVTTPPYPQTNPNQLQDATINTAFIGMMLSAGITSPAGSTSDVIYWQAGCVFNNSVLPIVPM